jgi:hypothetical protein
MNEDQIKELIIKNLSLKSHYYYIGNSSVMHRLSLHYDDVEISDILIEVDLPKDDWGCP